VRLRLFEGLQEEDDAAPPIESLQEVVGAPAPAPAPIEDSDEDSSDTGSSDG
jgi:hypothetical protein